MEIQGIMKLRRFARGDVRADLDSLKMATPPTLLILGTRGIPAAHGGFETFAEKLALFLVERGWRVGVYCQDEVTTVTQRFRSEMWRGIELIRTQVASEGPRATLEFDWHCVRDAARGCQPRAGL